MKAFATQEREREIMLPIRSKTAVFDRSDEFGSRNSAKLTESQHNILDGKPLKTTVFRNLENAVFGLFEP